MRSSKLLTLVLAVTAACGLWATGCGDDDQPGVRLVTIQLEPTTATMQVGTTEEFVATGVYSDSSTQNLTASATWASSDEAVATVELGLATAVDAGTASITATFEGITGTATVTVTSPEVEQVIVTPPNATIGIDDTADFTARAVYDDGSDADVTDTATWTSSDDTIATVAAGTVTGVAGGTVTVVARFDGVDSNAATVVVNPDLELESIQVTPAAATIAIDATQQYLALGTYNDGSSRDLTGDVTWDSSDTGIATISAAGVATGVAAGETTITAELDGITSNDATLTVSEAELVAITLSPVSGTLYAGSTDTLAVTATGSYDDGSTSDLTALATWASSDDTIATVSNAAGSEGVVSPSATNNGVVQVTATFGGITSSPAVITVLPATVVTSVVVDPATATIVDGATQAFTATATYADGRSADVTATATWASSDTAVATVSATGLATSASAGASDITATYGGQTGTAVLTVTAATIVSIAVTPAVATIPAGTTQDFEAVATLTDGSTSTITASATWTSSATAIATMTGATATGVAAGTATITATQGTVSGTATLVVTAATLTSISVTPPTSTIPVSGNVALTATGTYSDGSTNPITTTVGWTTSNAAVATVAGGVVTGVSTGGPVTITATSGTITGTAQVTVSGGILTSITVTPATPAALPVGRTQAFIATGNYSDGSTNPLTADANLTWTSSNVAAATISNAAGTKGTATAVAAGATNITARYVSGPTDVTSAPVILNVTAAVIESITVAPATATIPAGFTVALTATGSYSDGSTPDITNSCSWTSSAVGTATVSTTGTTGRGVVTGVAAGGPVTITCALGGRTGTAAVTVSTATLTRVDVNPATATVNVGATQTFTATGTFSDTSTRNITQDVDWTSSAPGVATMSVPPALKGIATGVSAGASTITARHVSGVQDTAALTVTNSTVTSVEVHYYAPGTVDACAGTPVDNFLTALVIGVNVQARAVARFADGRCTEVTSLATWAPASGTVLTVSNAAGSQGLVAPVGQGTANIIATYNSVPSTPVVAMVYNCLVTGVTVTPVDSTIYLGQTQNFAAAAVYGVATAGNCTAVPGTLQAHNITNQVTWSSSNTTVATVVPGTGVASAVAAGTTTIQARWNPSVAGSTNLTVENACVESIDLLPGDVTLPYVGGWPAQAFQPLSVVVHYSNATSPTITDAAHVTWSGDALGSGGHFTVSGWNVSATGATTAAEPLTATLLGSAGYTLCSGGTWTDSINLQARATTLTGITVTPADRTVSRGQLVTYTATGAFADTSSFDITPAVNAAGSWTSSLTSIATMANNVATASSTNEGTTVIRAVVSGVTGLTGLTVSGRTVEAVRVTIQGAGGATTFPVGVPLWFLVEADYSDTPGFVPATDAVTSWTITPSTAAEVRATYPLQGNNQLVVTTGAAATMYVDACVGTVCAGTANRAGPFTVQAVALEYVQVTGTVNDPQFVYTGLDGVTPPYNYRYDMYRGILAQMNVTAHFTTLGDYDVTRIASWTSDTPARVAMVTTAGSEGQIQSSTTVGAARITATHGGQSNYGTVTVVSDGTCYQAIRILPATQTVAAGLTVLYTAERQSNAGTWTTIAGTNWRSDNTAVAQYTGTSGQFRGIAAGSTTVRVNHTPGSLCAGLTAPLTASAGITVSAHTIAALDVLCTDPTGGALAAIPVGVWATCKAYARYSDESAFTYDAEHDVTDQALWSIAPSTIADVTDQDVAEIVGRAAGTGLIGASVGAINDSYPLTVNTSTLSSVSVTPGATDNTLRSPIGPAGSRFQRQFQAVANYTGGLSYNVTGRAGTTWTSHTTTLCSVDNVAPNKGLGTTITNGTCRISATWASMESNRAYWRIQNTTPDEVCHLAPNPANLPRSTTLQLAADLCWTATDRCLDMPSCDRPATSLVTWATGNSAVATINATGLITAGATASTTSMTASYTGATAATGTINVTERCVNGMTVSLSTSEAAPGVPVLGTATVTFSTGAPATAVATWTSSNNDAIQPASGGVYYNYLARAAGTANLIATYAGADPLCSGTTLTASAPITVHAGTLDTIAISPSPISAAVAQRVTITARGNYSGGRSFDITPVATWTTGTTAVASVAAEPGATPPRHYLQGEGTGTTTLNADYRGVYASAPVTISGGLVDQVWVLGTNTNAPAGGCSELPCSRLVIDNGSNGGTTDAYGWRSTAPVGACVDATWRHPVSTTTITYTTRVTATLHYTDNHYETDAAAVAWTSSDPAVATVAADGLVTIGITAGTTTITATYTPSGGGTAITDTLTFTSVSGALAAVRINGAAATVNIPDGTQNDLYAEGRFGATDWYCIEPTASWTTGSATVATVVASSGLTTGESVGTTTITAALGGVTDDIGVAVTAAVLQYVEVLPATLTVENGELFQLQAIGHYSDSSTADLTAAPTTACSTRTWQAENAGGAVITTPIQAVGTTGQFQASSSATGAARAEFCCGSVCAGGTTDRRATVTVTAP